MDSQNYWGAKSRLLVSIFWSLPPRMSFYVVENISIGTENWARILFVLLLSPLFTFFFFLSILTLSSSLPPPTVFLCTRNRMFHNLSTVSDFPPFSSEADSINYHAVYSAHHQLVSLCPLPPSLACIPSKFGACPRHFYGMSLLQSDTPKMAF